MPLIALLVSVDLGRSSCADILRHRYLVVKIRRKSPLRVESFQWLAAVWWEPSVNSHRWGASAPRYAGFTEHRKVSRQLPKRCRYYRRDCLLGGINNPGGSLDRYFESLESWPRIRQLGRSTGLDAVLRVGENLHRVQALGAQVKKLRTGGSTGRRRDFWSMLLRSGRQEARTTSSRRWRPRAAVNGKQSRTTCSTWR